MSSNAAPIIGLEIHCQVATNTRLFSSGHVDSQAAPNSGLTAYDIGSPGTLPVLNDRAVEFAIRAGHALNCNIHEDSRFDRKHYFYPDLPKGYQITQYYRPLCTEGHFEFDVDSKAAQTRICRIHLEEDAGKSIHGDGDHSLIDFNRAGTPLIEIVTAPDLETPEQAEACLRALHRLVVYLEICDGNLEEGSFRCDANISLAVEGDARSPRTELKNLNSFRHVRRALNFEIQRQRTALEMGRQIRDETRRYDARRDETVAMRAKESSPDYRYMPDPDLPPLRISSEEIRRIKDRIPELPRRRKRRFVDEHGLSADASEILVDRRRRADYFEAALASYGQHPTGLANLLINDVLRYVDGEMRIDELRLSPSDLADICRLVDRGVINSSAVSAVLEELLDSDDDPEAVVDRLELRQVRDPRKLDRLVDAVVDEYPEIVDRYRRGEKRLIRFFMGQIMKRSKGRADPKIAKDLLLSHLSEGDRSN